MRQRAWLSRLTAGGALIGVVALGLTVAHAAPDTCTAADLTAAVESAGAELRAFNSKALPVVRDKFDRLATKRGWSKEEAEERALAEIEDAEISKLDAEANELLTKFDLLGRPTEGAETDCTKVAGLKSSGATLLAIMKKKSDLTNAKLDRALGLLPPPVEKPEPAAKPAPQKAAEPVKPAAPKQDAYTPPAPETWETTAEGAVPLGPVTAATPGSLPPGSFTPDVGDDGYSIEEIRDATKGFFGTISTNLATVLEHAFSVAGRPTAYVLGTEGGGAFLAGLRYGSGDLFMRAGGKSQVFWHGPSIGTDFGASGSRTLFLIYKLRQPGDIFRTFSGVDGSAYLVGGIGFTLMKGGKVIMAPIRTGLGLRFGANIGYVRFTPQATWNPF